MRIGRNNIAFMAIRSKLIRSRKTKMRSGTQYSSWAGKSTSSTSKSSAARTLSQKKALAEKNSKKSTFTSETMLEKTKKNYTSMETAAENTVKHLQKLLNTGENSLWGNEAAEQETEPDTEKIKNEITDFTEYYNDLVQSLEAEGGTISTMYIKQLHNYNVSFKSKLENIGITENKYGKLELDKTKLQGADTEKLKELFQGEGSFADKVCNRCKKAQENAEANLNSLNSATYSSLLAGYGISGSRFNSKA